MSNQVLLRYGIDPNLPTRRILELLQDKNLEYLERLDACQDRSRAEELRQKQQEIEEAIMTCSTGLSLDRRVQNRKQGATAPSGAASAPEDRLGAALLAYQSGDYDRALPVLNEFAEAGDALACVLAANILLQRKESRSASRLLFRAAEQGDGTAAFMLARQFFQEGNIVSADKWGKAALQQKVVGSGRLLAQAAVADRRPLDGEKALLEELAWTSGYDRYALTLSICDLLDQTGLTYEKLAPHVQELLRRLEGDKRCTEAAEKFYEEKKAPKKLLRHFALLNCFILPIVVTIVTHKLNRWISSTLPLLSVLIYFSPLLCGLCPYWMEKLYCKLDAGYCPGTMSWKRLAIVFVAGTVLLSYILQELGVWGINITSLACAFTTALTLNQSAWKVNRNPLD